MRTVLGRLIRGLAKAAEAAEQAKKQLAQAQDRAVANYKENHGMSGTPAAAKTKK